MAKLIYASNASLDGWTEDADGGFDWAPPDEEVFTAISGVMASAGTYLYGRRMYETMAPWETEPSLAEASDLTARFASIWQAPDKVVYSSTLAEPVTSSRSEARPPQSMCTCESMRPGTTVPGSSRVGVPAGRAAAASARLPVATTRPASTATASTRGAAGSMVMTSPQTRRLFRSRFIA